MNNDKAKARISYEFFLCKAYNGYITTRLSQLMRNSYTKNTLIIWDKIHERTGNLQ